MDLYKKLEEDMRNALRNSDAVRLSVLRMLISEIKKFEIDHGLKKVDDPDIFPIVQKQIKQHKESIEQFEKGNRSDLVDKEKKELAILQLYMPQQLTEEELLAVIKETIAQTGAVAKSEVGKVMKMVMEKVKGKADGKRVNQIAMGLLK